MCPLPPASLHWVAGALWATPSSPEQSTVRQCLNPSVACRCCLNPASPRAFCSASVAMACIFACMNVPASSSVQQQRRRRHERKASFAAMSRRRQCCLFAVLSVGKGKEAHLNILLFSVENDSLAQWQASSSSTQWAWVRNPANANKPPPFLHFC